MLVVRRFPCFVYKLNVTTRGWHIASSHRDQRRSPGTSRLLVELEQGLHMCTAAAKYHRQKGALNICEVGSLGQSANQSEAEYNSRQGEFRKLILDTAYDVHIFSEPDEKDPQSLLTIYVVDSLQFLTFVV